MPNTIGEAYIQIIPTTDGIGGNLEKALSGEAASAGSNAGNAFSKGFGSVMKVTTAAVAASATAVVGFGKSSVEAGMSFDKAMSQVAATMGYVVDGEKMLDAEGNDVSKTFDELNAFAQKMGSETQFSASQAAEALNYMALAGYDAETSMEMMPKVLNLAAAGDMALAQASDMVTDAQSALGLTIDETNDMVDMMARTASVSNTSVKQLGEAFLTVGPTAKMVSGGVQEMSTVLGTLANSGIKGSEAGTHLRNMLLAMNPTTDKAAAAWEQLGISGYDAEGNLRPLGDTFRDLSEAMTGMSDQERTSMLTAMFNKTDLSSVNTMLAATAGNAEEVTAALESAGLSLEDFEGSFSVDGVDSNGLTMALANGFMRVKEGALATDEQIKDFTASLSEYGLTTEQANTFTKTFLDNAIEGGNTFEELNNKVGQFEGTAANMAETMLDNLAGDVTKFKSALEGTQIAISDGITPVLREFVKFGTNALSEMTAAYKEGGLDGLMASLGETLSSGLQQLFENLPGLINSAMALLNTLGQGIIKNLPILAQSAMQIIVQLANDLSSQLPTLIPTVVEILLQIVDTLLDNIDLLIDASMQLTVGFAEGLINALPVLLEKAPEIISKLVTALLESLPILLEAGGQLIIALGKGLILAVPQLLAAVAELHVKVKDALLEFIKKMPQMGKDLVAGINKGFKDAVPGFISSAKESLSKLVDSLKNLFKIGSPSKIMDEEIGQWLPAGVAVGINKNADLPVKALDEMANDMTGTIQSQITADMAGTPAYSPSAEIASTDNSGLYDIMAQYLPEIAAGGNTTIALEGDAAGLFNMIKRQNNMEKRMSGRSAFA